MIVETVSIDGYFGNQPSRLDLGRMDIKRYETFPLWRLEMTLRSKSRAVLGTKCHPVMIGASGGSPAEFINLYCAQATP